MVLLIAGLKSYSQEIYDVEIDGSLKQCIQVLKKNRKVRYALLKRLEEDKYCYRDRVINIAHDSLVITNGIDILELASAPVVNEILISRNESSLKLYGFSAASTDFLILISHSTAATGLAISYYDWIIVDLQTGSNFITRSLSEDPILLCEKGNTIELITIEFSEYYSDTKDTEHISWDMLQYGYDGSMFRLTKRIRDFCRK